MIRTTLVCMAIFAVAAPASAQDVIMRGRVHGTPIPEWIQQKLAANPNAFEFKRAWIHKTARIRELRAALAAGNAQVLASPSQLASAGAALTGTLRVPVILGLYSDATAPYTPAEYDNQLFGEGTTPYTLKSYYQELSRGLFEIDGEAHGWVNLPQPASYYDPSDATHPEYGRTGEFLRDALTAADPATDFSLYDNDGLDGIPNSGDDDGFVDVTTFLYPSWGKACGGPGIWPHKSTYEGWWGGQPFETNDPAANGGFIKVSDYFIQGGVACDGSSIMNIGTIAHELGHALALPDLYDTTPQDPDSEGIGIWGLMGAGSYNTLSSPAHMSAWSKLFLGWIPVVTVDRDTSITLAPAETVGEAIRLDVPGSPGEYFLIENRQALKSDLYLRGGGGLLIWHVDSTIIADNSLINQVNGDETHKGVGLEEADGLNDLDGVAGSDGNRGDAGDPFPGSTGNTTFSDLTNPNSDGYSGVPSGIALNSISQSGQDMTFNVTFGTPGTTTAYWGDVTEDDVVDEADVEAILTALIGGTHSADMSVADVDADGDADARDGLIVHSYAVGMDLSGCAECRVGEQVSGSPVAPDIIVRRPVGSGDAIRALIQRVNSRGFEE